jgi:hypothetical protein
MPGFGKNSCPGHDHDDDDHEQYEQLKNPYLGAKHTVSSQGAIQSPVQKVVVVDPAALDKTGYNTGILPLGSRRFEASIPCL